MKKTDFTLYLVTDSTGMSENEFLSKTEEAIKGGVTIVQLREKNRSTREYISLAKKLHNITKKYKIPLIIDDRIDVLIASGAEGVHLGKEDMPIKLARKILGSSYLIGATAKTVKTAKKAERDGADYLGVGAIYPTTTKVKTRITKVETLREIKKSVSIPVNAIGGLTKSNLDILKGSGIDGICVVSAIMKAENPMEEAKILKTIVKGEIL